MNPIQVEIYRHLFSSIAEEMGVTLMRSAFSPNIKERRDFSCALFDAHGEMVAQAAHIPVHLGSTAMSVDAARLAFKPEDGTHVILNDPYAGGTHLPDITLVTPVFDDSENLRFFVANRAHHADVGGISAGSLPLSKHIDDEGIRIPPTLLTDDVVEQICAASRTPDERRGDLTAQIAANLRGAQRLKEQMRSIGAIELAQNAAQLLAFSESYMRSVLREFGDGSWTFEDVMDSDGHGGGPYPIRCDLTLADGALTADFRGAPRQVDGPINVPKAVTVSAVLYVVRCLAPPELPSNGGYMRCVKILTTPGSLFDAEFPAPVAIGNVETSQRITDVVFGALAQGFPNEVPAASCGSMNNITIGGRDADGKPFAYYETIGGGSGAMCGGHGASGIQTHMTNTLNTPVEALENAYPFRLERYSLRPNSGGAGKWRGGDGIVRAYRFTSDATVTVMTERRVSQPYGLEGGAPGAPGRNRLIRDGQITELPDKHTFDVFDGDVVEILTPGGGGFGSPV